MWKYIKRYLNFAILAALFMIGEVLVDLIQPGLMGQIVDNGVLGIGNNGTANINLVWTLGLEMILLVIFGGFCGSMNNVFVHMSGQNIANEMRKDCFQSIMAFSFSQTDKYSTGSLITRVTNDITQVQNFVSQFVCGMVRTVFLTFGSIYFMFRLNVKFGLVVLCAFPFMAGCMALCLSKANPLFSKLQDRLDNINSIMQEDISGIRIIKACVQEMHEKKRFGKANDKLIKTQIKILNIFAFMNPVVNAIMYIVVTIILLAGFYEAESGTVTPGNIMAAITYTTQLLNGILMLVMLFQNISRGYASWKRVKEIITSRPGLEDGTYNSQTDVKGTIEFKDVSFSYPGSDKIVLEHINFKIKQGETVAIMGSTGCGKSTLVNLIPRFYDAISGAVLVNGVNVKEYNQKALREKIAVAMQKTELFSGTIKENISWGNPDASNDEIKTAAKTAQADGFINQAENGYNTSLAEGGMNLSGGQKQRISIARAILKPCEILVFDDSTSALDLKTEADLYNALGKFKHDITKIIVAQRIASVRQADKIIILDKGRIASEIS